MPLEALLSVIGAVIILNSVQNYFHQSQAAACCIICGIRACVLYGRNNSRRFFRSNALFIIVSSILSSKSTNFISKDEHSGSSGPGRLGKNKSDQQARIAQLGRREGEVMRKPRGRPPGSKNRPKPPIIISSDTGSGLRPHVLEIPSGCDVGESIAAFARKGQRELFVLAGIGSVSNVALRQPSAGGSTVTLHGCFEILAMSGAFIFQPTPFATAGLTISLAGAQGQVLGGNVVGSLMAASPVLVIAASVLGPSYDRLPDVEDDDEAKLLAAATTISVAPPDPSSMGLYSISQSPFGSSQLPQDILAWAIGPRTQF